MANRDGDGTEKESDSTPQSLGIGSDCRARRIGVIREFSDCLITSERQCEFSFFFGSGRLCRHPNHALIVSRTEAGDKKVR